MIENKTLPKVPDLVAPEPADIPLSKFNTAIVINNIVHQVVNYSDEFYQILLSNPKFIIVNGKGVKSGWIYDENTGTFSDPAQS